MPHRSAPSRRITVPLTSGWRRAQARAARAVVKKLTYPQERSAAGPLVPHVAPPASGCNEAAIWSFTKPINSKGAPLYGTEIAWQQPFDFLPSINTVLEPADNFLIRASAAFVMARPDLAQAQILRFTRPAMARRWLRQTASE